MSFQRAVAFVLAHESGELTENASDPGGLTRWGIALARHPELTAADIRAMTPERAAAIYSAQYWGAIHGDELPEYLQLPMLDAAVVQGPPHACRFLQAALYVMPLDGILGPATLGSVRRADPMTTLSAFTAERIAHLVSLPDYARFGKGWIRRAVRAALESP